MATALEPLVSSPPRSAPGRRVAPSMLTQCVQALIQTSVHRVLIATTEGEPLLEISLVMPTSARLILRVLDAVDVIAASAVGPVVIDVLPVHRPSYRGGRKLGGARASAGAAFVARALRTATTLVTIDRVQEGHMS